ncbi:hypothetical protein BMETH_425200621561075, partial [methanotrophic bacterial endosymbiont of Bathymodiolus sp.]
QSDCGVGRLSADLWRDISPESGEIIAKNLKHIAVTTAAQLVSIGFYLPY